MRKYKTRKTQNDWEDYKQWRNFAVASIRREKAAYLSSLERLQDTRKLWRGLESLNIRPARRECQLPYGLQDPDKINNYFSDIFQKSDACNEKIGFYNSNRHSDKQFSFKLVDQASVVDAVMSIKSGAPGNDGISLRMIKYCLPIIVNHLTHIINCCLEVGYFPESWRESIVRPIPKVKTPSSLSDLRPISLLPVFSKNIRAYCLLSVE